jgi:AAA15 family ATPase/GTPase
VLRSFRCENHRSFRDEAELSLLPAYGKNRTPVPVAAIYGANAAGKSNLLDGLRFMSSAVRNSYRRWEPTAGVPRSPFRLAANASSRPSTYVIELILDGVRHVYGFVINDEQVHEEWLYAYPRGRRRMLFERQGLTFDLGDSLGGARTKADVLSELTRPNALFLSLAAQVGITEVSPIYDWFVGGGLRISDPAVRASESRMNHAAMVELAQGSEADQHRFLSLVQAADIGISEFIVEDQPDLVMSNPGVRIYKNRNSTTQWYLTERVENESLDDSTTKNDLEIRLDELLHAYGSTVKFRHGESELFDLADESAGTRSWLSLLPLVLSVLDDGGTLLIDEIDSSLHPNLTALLIRQFQSADTNPLGAQLIFTTHDATLLGTSFGEEVLARDQVWFVEKEPDGASRLYPLTDFHPRTGENRERRYLNGSYGGVPVIGLPDLRPPSTPEEPNAASSRSRAAEAADA